MQMQISEILYKKIVIYALREGARVTELGSMHTVAGLRSEAVSHLICTYHMAPKKAQLGILLRKYKLITNNHSQIVKSACFYGMV